jgi:hypothetical protein
MSRSLLLAIALLLPWAAWADGKVYPQRAIAKPATVPDQRALLWWSNGLERLVVETRFASEGTNFAWVVPLPAKPEIEPATKGLFPTLEYLLAPELVHNVQRYYLGILALLGLLYLIFRVKPGKTLTIPVAGSWLLVSACTLAAHPAAGMCVSFFLGTAILLVRFESKSFFTILVLSVLTLLAFGLFLPAATRSRAMAIAGSIPARVEVLERQQAGLFDTVTLAASDASALTEWLNVNGYALSANSQPVVERYVKEGWVFTAARLHRAASTTELTTAHPLSFTFRTAEPVYPMRLTGVDNGPLSVELFVFGPARAQAPGFKLEHCTKPAFVTPPGGWAWRKPSELQIHTPPLREWVFGSAVASRLTARLSPEQMQQDVRLRWQPFKEQQSQVFSQRGARDYAANWASAGLLAGLTLQAILLAFGRDRESRSWSTGLVIGLALAWGCCIYLYVPKTEAELKRGWRGAGEMTLREASIYFAECDPATDLTDLRLRLKRAMADVAEDNGILGGRIREEDSPGNYSLRVNSNSVDFIGYDAAAVPRLLETISLRTNSP